MAQRLENPGYNVQRTRGADFVDNKVEETGSTDNHLWTRSLLEDESGNPIDSSNPLPVTSTSPIPTHTDMEGLGLITVSTTAIELTFSIDTETIIITSDASNTYPIYIGKSDVTSAGANALLVKAIQEQQEEINILKDKIA